MITWNAPMPQLAVDQSNEVETSVLSVPGAIVSKFTSRSRLAFIALATGFLAVVGAASPALAAPYNPSNLPSPQLERVSRICESVVGVHRGEEHFDSCLESLSGSLAGAAQDSGMQRARGDCLAKGYAANSPALAECTLRAGSAQASWGAADVSDGAGGEPGMTKSYFYASPSEAHRREQLACARLGLDPTGGAFDSCVASLQSSLFAADHPQN
jgi:hypothetical protein